MSLWNRVRQLAEGVFAGSGARAATDEAIYLTEAAYRNRRPAAAKAPEIRERHFGLGVRRAKAARDAAAAAAPGSEAYAGTKIVGTPHKPKAPPAAPEPELRVREEKSPQPRPAPPEAPVAIPAVEAEAPARDAKAARPLQPAPRPAQPRPQPRRPTTRRCCAICSASRRRGSRKRPGRRRPPRPFPRPCPRLPPRRRRRWIAATSPSPPSA